MRLAERAAEGLGLDYHTQTAHGREGMVGERPRAEIGMHAVRGPDADCEHTGCPQSAGDAGAGHKEGQRCGSELEEFASGSGSR